MYQKTTDETVYIIKPPPAIFYFVECVFSYNPSNHVCYGFLRTNIPEAMPYFESLILRHARTANNPLFLMGMIAEWQNENICMTCTKIGNNIMKIENKSGHKVYNCAPVMDDAPETASFDLQVVVSDDPTRFQSLTADLATLNYRIATAELYATSSMNLCDLGLKQNDDQLGDSLLQSSSNLRDIKELRQQIECVANSLYQSKLRLHMFGKRAQFQVSTVRMTEPRNMLIIGS